MPRKRPRRRKSQLLKRYELSCSSTCFPPPFEKGLLCTREANVRNRMPNLPRLLRLQREGWHVQHLGGSSEFAPFIWN